MNLDTYYRFDAGLNTDADDYFALSDCLIEEYQNIFSNVLTSLAWGNDAGGFEDIVKWYQVGVKGQVGGKLP